MLYENDLEEQYIPRSRHFLPKMLQVFHENPTEWRLHSTCDAFFYTFALL